MDGEVPEEERFARNAIIMAQAVSECVQQLYSAGYKTVDPTLIMFAANVISAFDRSFLIQGFIENSHAHCWDKIKGRDEIFFTNNVSEVFKYLPMDKVNLFKDLFLTKDVNGNSVVSQGLKNQVWNLFDAMIKISIKYIHKHRSPYSYQGPHGIVNTYGAQFFDEVDIGYHSQVWGVKLEFPLGV